MTTQRINFRAFSAFNMLLILVIVFACKNPSQKITASESAEDQVKKTLIAMWDAIEKEDIELYAQYVHPDFTQFGETDPLRLEGKASEIAGVKSWLEESDNLHTEMIDPKVTVKGDVAWITYYWSDKGTTSGEQFSSKGKSTRIFVLEDDKWLCIHGHYTLLP